VTASPATPTETLERRIRIAAAPELVFSFFTDPVKMAQWNGTMCTLDPKPGGIFRVGINPHIVQRGQYVEVVPHSRIVFTWGFEGEASPVPPGATTVEITLVPDGGGTIVHLRHFGFPVGEMGGPEASWDYYLERLVKVAEGRDPGIDVWIDAPGIPG
jgi:uncharacterized protein YndB with AHSA1/START domain